MSDRVQLTIPVELSDRARSEALRTGRDFEDILVSWLSTGADLERQNQGYYEVWSPHASDEAISSLARLLDEDRLQHG